MLLLYDLAIWLYLLAIRLAAPFLPKARSWVNGRQRLFQKLEQSLPADRPILWMHCASLGEFEQGRPLLEQLRNHYPQHFLLLTFFSPSGYDIRKNYPLVDYVCYLPADTRRKAHRFVDLVKPQLAIFIKYEFWYHHLHALHQAKVPTLLVSAVFRPQQLFFRPWGRFFRKVLREYEHIFVQDSNSLDLLKRHQVTAVSLGGDTRVDRVGQLAAEGIEDPLVAAFVKGHRVLIGGSTWPADEALLCPFIIEKKEERWKYILAPHDIKEGHIQQIEARLQVKSIRYSALSKSGESDAKVLIIDNIGKLSSIYRYGHTAYIGGGFGDGIHNILEPAAYGLPVIFGPRYHKFGEAVQLIAQEAAFSVKSYQQLKEQLESLGGEVAHQRAKAAATAFIQSQSGATQKVMAYIQKLLK